MSLRRAALLLVLAGPAACTGQVGTADPVAPSPPGTPGSSQPDPDRGEPTRPAPSRPGPDPSPKPPTPPPAAASEAGPYPLRRLGNEEFAHSVADLLGLSDSQKKAIAADLPGEAAGESGFVLPGILGPDEVRRFGQKGREAATLMAAKALPTCAPGAEEACTATFLDGFVTRAFRRPPEKPEMDELLALYRGFRTAGALHDEALRELVAAVLQMPQFLYHGLETTGPAVREGNRVKLGPYQIAARLSYFFWKTTPDSKLLTAAATGKLATTADVEREARRLLADKRSLRAVEAFYVELLRAEEVEVVPKDAVFSAFKPAIRNLMIEEVEGFVGDVFRDGDGKLETLLTAQHTFVEEQLGRYYGLPETTGKSLRKVTVPGERAGILTLGATLAVHATAAEASPIKRGAFLRQRILCQQLPPQPEAVPQLPEAEAGGTVRERLAQHTKDPACRGCHELLDPAGYAFSAFDAVGRYQPTEGGKPVDASGYIANLDGARREYRTLPELAALVAGSEEVRRCAVRQWFRYAVGRSEEPGEAGALEAATKAFIAGGGNLRELMVTIATSPAFLHRAPVANEP